jgi:hypothetical protein
MDSSMIRKLQMLKIAVLMVREAELASQAPKLLIPLGKCNIEIIGLDRKISKEILAKRGLISCVEYYLN